MPEESKITRETAKAMYAAQWWKDLPARDVALAQLREPRLCMDMGDFQAAIEKALGRPVWTHELVHPEHLIAEMEGEKDAPSMEDILAMIPADKLLIVDHP